MKKECREPHERCRFLTHHPHHHSVGDRDGSVDHVRRRLPESPTASSPVVYFVATLNGWACMAGVYDSTDSAFGCGIKGASNCAGGLDLVVAA